MGIPTVCRLHAYWVGCFLEKSDDALGAGGRVRFFRTAEPILFKSDLIGYFCDPSSSPQATR